ncbi:MAG TPA: hypothetical protein VG841_14235 [Caulobacterales bacterium]|nr:hypothetical protein [Caulobacterales bacterium]
MAAIGAALGLSAADADDLALLLGAYAAAVLFLLLAYVLAGQVWVERHSVRCATAKGERRMSGFWGEFVLVTACALVVAVALIFTSIDLTDLITGHVMGIAIAFAAVFLIYLVYAFSVVADAKKEGKDGAYLSRLRNAYMSYAFYSVIFFACGVVVVALLGFEFVADRADFDAQAQSVLATLSQAQTAALDPARDAAGRVGASLAFVEDANGGVAMATNLLQDQMNPTFLFAACVFFVNILIVATPIKYAFLNNATAITHVSTGVAVAGILLIGLLIYFGSYSVLIEHALEALKPLRPDPALGEWEATQRYNEIVVELSARRNLLGFASSMGGAGSGLALFAAAIQFGFDRAAKSDK